MRASYNGNHSYNVPTLINYNQVHPNTLGINDPSIQAQVPFPQLQFFQVASNDGFGNYNAGTIEVHKRSSSLQFGASYTYTRNLSNIIGAATSSAQGFASEFGNELSDPYHPGIDYGEVLGRSPVLVDLRGVTRKLAKQAAAARAAVAGDQPYAGTTDSEMASEDRSIASLAASSTST